MLVIIAIVIYILNLYDDKLLWIYTDNVYVVTTAKATYFCVLLQTLPILYKAMFHGIIGPLSLQRTASFMNLLIDWVLFSVLIYLLAFFYD